MMMHFYNFNQTLKDFLKEKALISSGKVTPLSYLSASERSFVEIFLSAITDHSAFYDDSSDNWIPNFFLCHPHNAFIFHSDVYPESHITGISIDLSRCDFSFREDLLNLENLSKIIIYHQEYRPLIESIPPDQFIPLLYQQPNAKYYHPHLQFSQFLFHRLLPIHDVEGFSQMLEYVTQKSVYQNYGIIYLERKTNREFPVTSDKLGLSSDPSSLHFPYTEESANFHENQEKELYKRIFESRGDGD